MAGDGSAPGRSEVLDLLGRGDPGFVDAIRRVREPAILADLAATWLGDPRPEARRLLLDYLDRPLDAPGHAILIKRLFKRAEAAGDAEVMARFLVLLDRSDRRVRAVRRATARRDFATAEEAEAAAALLATQGYTGVLVGRSRRAHWLIVRHSEEVLRQPMPEGSRLFSLATRRYLRRRAWRFFRKLGKAEPGRYVGAIGEALVLYRDEDVADGPALIDNWGLVHALFHHSPVLVAHPRGWRVAPGRSLAELAPAPMFGPLWDEAPASVVDLLIRGRCRTVRAWATRRIGGEPGRFRGTLDAGGWFGLLGHDDPDVARLAAGMLGDDPGGLDAIEVDRWVGLIESSRPEALEANCDLARRHVRPDRASTAQALRLAGSGLLPAARLGLAWLAGRAGQGGEAGPDPALLGLLDARCGALRPEILRRLRGAFAGSAARASVIEAFLDSRHRDARALGWAWFEGEPAIRDDVEAWRRLLESPYDDVRIAVLDTLEARRGAGRAELARGLDPEAVRGLWASTLLNVHRGGRAKPSAVAQIVERLEARPGEAPSLLPILGVALRSVRGAERRAGLVAVVRLIERGGPAVEPLVRSAFGELHLD